MRMRLQLMTPGRKRLRPKGQTFMLTLSAPEEDQAETQLKANGSQGPPKTEWSSAERIRGLSEKSKEQKM